MKSPHHLGDSHRKSAQAVWIHMCKSNYGKSIILLYLKSSRTRVTHTATAFTHHIHTYTVVDWEKKGATRKVREREGWREGGRKQRGRGMKGQREREQERQRRTERGRLERERERLNGGG